jgi:hypothetical protein
MTKLLEQVITEIEKLPEDAQNAIAARWLFDLSSESKKEAAAPSLMTKLKQIKIDAPTDFATNLDLYVSGEKRGE